MLHNLPMRPVDSTELPASSAQPLDPLPAARLVAQDWPRIVRWQGAFWSWEHGAFHALTEDAVRAGVYRSLERMQERPTSKRVSNVIDALNAVALLNDELTPPCWIPSGEPLGRGKVPLRNGILDLRSGNLSEPTTDLFALAALPVAYQSDAVAPHWHEFLSQLWPDDADAIATLQELFGYLISGETHQQKVFLIVGPKRGGKGTILRIMTALMGQKNCAAPTLGSLSQPFGIQNLIGKTAAIISDARLSGRADQEAIAERLLSISGEDHVAVPRKFLSDFTAQLQTRFVLATNELPRLHDASGALASRFIPLVLTRSWYGREDHGLTERLLDELPGILQWSVEGYRRLMQRGRFVLPESAADAVQELHDLGSPIGAFVREACVVEGGAEIAVGELYRRWCAWCDEHGRNHPGTEQTFGRDLRAAVPGVTVSQPRRNGERVRLYRGIRVANSGDWHAMEREPNHCTRNGVDSYKHNAMDRVPPRATGESEPSDTDLQPGEERL